MEHTIATGIQDRLFVRVAAAQLDGDPQDELAVWSGSEDRLEGYDFAGGALVAAQTLQHPNPGAWVNWTSGDVDGDGDDDVVAFEMPSATTAALAHVFRRTGPTTFVREAPHAGGPATHLADVDGDGDLDGVCCGGGGPGSSGWPQLSNGSWFHVALNDGRGRMAPAFRFPGKGSAELAGVADVDGDGDVDLVAGACVYYARGPLRAAPTPSTLATYTGFVFDPRDLRDLDGDGDVDLVPTYVLEPVSRTMRPALGEAWVNQADGTFQRVVPPVPSPAIPAGYDVEVPVFVGDFDGDGAPDQVVPLSQGGSFSHMGLLLNNGSGQFRHAGAAAAPGLRMGWDDPAYRQPGNGHVDDLDGDGDLDLIATSEHASSGPFSTAPLRIEIYWNDGRGTFVPGPVVDDAQFQVAADFDGDGRKDLLSVSGGRVSFHLATGLASVPYGSAWALLQRPSPVTRGSPGLTVLDANDDGRPDVAVGGQLWCNTTPASMIGAASFVPASLGIEGDSLYAIDVDGDGRTDLVSYNPATSQFALRVYRRHSGDGAVLAASDFDPPVAHVGFGVWPVDADGDGDTDLLGDYLLRNVRLEPPTGGAVRQYGPATAGEAGVAPLLGAVGPFVPRSNVELRLSRVTGPTTGIIVVGVAEAALPAFPVPGVTLLVDPGQVAVQLWPVTEAGQGYAAAGATLPLRLIAAARGLEFFAQALVYDPAAPGSFAASNGVRFAVGQ